MKVSINGKISDINDNINLASLLKQKKLSFEHVVVEINGRITEKEKYLETRIHPSDKIEILYFVGGG